MRKRRVDVGLGALYVGLVLVFVVVAMLVYNKAFTDKVTVTLQTDSVGNALQKNSDVKVRGVPVGTVQRIRPTASGADITLELDPAKAQQLPADTTARLLPKTLFGERYVSLSLPETASTTHLASGDTIHQDTSATAVELEQVFDSLLPLLTAVQPEKISATLSEVAQALRGQGKDLGDTLTQTAAYLTKLDPHVPQLAEDLGRLGSVAKTYDAAVPDLLGALDSLSVTTRTIAADQAQLSTVYATVATSANTTTGFLTPNEDTIVVLSQQGAKALGAVAPYASEFPCTFRALRDFIPVMDTVLGKGTAKPGLHATLKVVPSRGKYVPGKDKVTYGGGKPSCPYTPGASNRDDEPALATAAPPSAANPSTGVVARAQTNATAGLGKANSPAENQLIAELVAPEQGMNPSDFPRWGSLLLGPTMRGQVVDVQTTPQNHSLRSRFRGNPGETR